MLQHVSNEAVEGREAYTQMLRVLGINSGSEYGVIRELAVPELGLFQAHPLQLTLTNQGRVYLEAVASAPMVAHITGDVEPEAYWLALQPYLASPRAKRSGLAVDVVAGLQEQLMSNGLYLNPEILT